MYSLITKISQHMQDWMYIFLIITVVTFLIIWFYYRKDVYDPEPVRLIVYAFILGILSVIPSFIVEFGAYFFIGQTIYLAILIAPITEEFFKYRMVLRISRKDAFDGPLDGMVYGAVVGCGFAAIENVLYGYQQLVTNGFFDSLFLTSFRSITEFIGHPFFTGLIGIYIGKQKVHLTSSHRSKLWRPIVLHSIWNTNASLGTTHNLEIVLVLVILYAIILRRNIKYAFKLDKIAYEDGFYTRKKQSNGKLIENWQKYVT